MERNKDKKYTRQKRAGNLEKQDAVEIFCEPEVRFQKFKKHYHHLLSTFISENIIFWFTSPLRFAFSACLFCIISIISIVGPFLSENESGVLRAHRALRGKNSDQRN